MPHSDNPPAPPGSPRCERCNKPYARDSSAWDLCLSCLERALEQMPTKELADVPGAVLRLVDPNLKEEYFRE